MNKTQSNCKLSNTTIIGKHNNVAITFKDLSNMSDHSLSRIFSINSNGQTVEIDSIVINTLMYEYFEKHFMEQDIFTKKEKCDKFGVFMTELVPKHIEKWTCYNILYWGNVALILNKTSVYHDILNINRI
jgi:hypothetical protein